MKQPEGQLPPTSLPPCFLSSTPAPLQRQGFVYYTPQPGALAQISPVINVLGTRHRAICDGLWLALSAAPSKFKFTAASSSHRAGARHRVVGVAWAPSSPATFLLVSQERLQRTAGNWVTAQATAWPAGQVYAAGAGGSPRA